MGIQFASGKPDSSASVAVGEAGTSRRDPPDGLPAYRILTGRDDAAFCRRVSGELAKGYELYGSPALTFNGEHPLVAQAIVWPKVGL
jgi:hypothetical protein